MRNLNLTDTIAAIATTIGESSIGVIRISGKDALAIANKVFLSLDGQKPSDFNSHTVHRGWITSGRDSEAVDEVLLTVMRGPKSYTGEDCVEISCHGGVIVLGSVLNLVLNQGCRLAQPGEFTKRAFLNGKMDLSQAEAVLDVIKAKTDSALKVSIRQLRGALSSKVNDIRNSLLDLLTILEANIDFPEEEITPASLKDIQDKLNKIDQRITGIISTSRQGRILREGINAVICGKPNVGKSSLLNALLKEERSIVTPLAGTTRDTIEEIIDIKGVPIKIIDTAGIIEPKDLIERKAIQRAKRYIQNADLVIFVFDGSKKLSFADEVLIKRLKNKVLPVINKSDLKQKIQKKRIVQIFGSAIEISAKKMKNINLLEEAIVVSVLGKTGYGLGGAMVSNIRHIQALKTAQKLIAGALNSLDNKLSIEFIAQDIKEALDYLDEILGKRFSQDLLDRIFSEFCIGK